MEYEPAGTSVNRKCPCALVSVRRLPPGIAGCENEKMTLLPVEVWAPPNVTIAPATGCVVPASTTRPASTARPAGGACGGEFCAMSTCTDTRTTPPSARAAARHPNRGLVMGIPRDHTPGLATPGSRHLDTSVVLNHSKGGRAHRKA